MNVINRHWEPQSTEKEQNEEETRETMNIQRAAAVFLKKKQTLQ